MSHTPDFCPNCGEEIPPRANVCPHCGSDEKTGWSEEAGNSGLDLPDENFNYDEYVKNEFGGKVKPRGLHWFWWLVALLLLIGVVLVCVP